MPKYVTKELQKFQYPNPRLSQYSPHQWTRPHYGVAKKLATPLDTSPTILEKKSAGSKKKEHSYTIPALWTALCYHPSTQ